VLSGSHATGEAVWASHDGRRVSLSDLDLYVILRDEAAVPVARRSLRLPPADVLLHAGLAGPAEAGFVTLEGLARMSARPGTVELARSARVIEGDPGLLARLPRWEPGAITQEERLRLLENRAFELLWARLIGSSGLEGLRAQHAVLKCALDLAASRALDRGELPASAASRVSLAIALGEPAGSPSWLAGAWPGLAPLWRAAVAWREGAAVACSRDALRADWHAAARGWAAAWWTETAPNSTSGEPFARALEAAARGSLARRLRHRCVRCPAGPRRKPWRRGSRIRRETDRSCQGGSHCCMPPPARRAPVAWRGRGARARGRARRRASRRCRRRAARASPASASRACARSTMWLACALCAWGRPLPSDAGSGA
jgi:hypothetical protein